MFTVYITVSVVVKTFLGLETETETWTNSSALESRDHDPEITTPVASIPIGDRILA